MSPHSDLHDPVIDWYRIHERPLPWRAPGTTPWGVLVSEVMAQQTPVARVAPFWVEWMRRWPRPADLAAALAADVLRAWGSLGYPRRALRLQQAAVALRDGHGGQVPTTVEQLRALPGVGEYTAAAVAVFALGQRHPVLDTNVRRVLARVVGGVAGPAPALSAAERALATSLLPPDRHRCRTWSVGVMELGALVCTARAPDCPSCPLRTRCRWLAGGRPEAARPSRRPQPWQGTDRQARGRIMKALREGAGPVSGQTLVRVWPEHAQRERCLDGLLADGLIEAHDDGYRLPGDTCRGAQVACAATGSRDG